MFLILLLKRFCRGSQLRIGGKLENGENVVRCASGGSCRRRAQLLTISSSFVRGRMPFFHSGGRGIFNFLRSHHRICRIDSCWCSLQCSRGGTRSADSDLIASTSLAIIGSSSSPTIAQGVENMLVHHCTRSCFSFFSNLRSP